MAQSFTDNPYSQATVVDTTMSAMENNDLALKSSFSGSSNPANAVAGMLHMRTGGTGDGLRVRNSGDSAWHKVLTGTASLKLWMYRNDTDEGWTLDASAPTDRVLSLKGGSNAYNVNGGTTAGNWTFTATVPYDGWGQDASSGAAGELLVSDQANTWAAGNINAASASRSITVIGSNRIAAAVGTLQYPDLS